MRSAECGVRVAGATCVVQFLVYAVHVLVHTHERHKEDTPDAAPMRPGVLGDVRKVDGVLSD